MSNQEGTDAQSTDRVMHFIRKHIRAMGWVHRALLVLLMLSGVVLTGDCVDQEGATAAAEPEVAVPLFRTEVFRSYFFCADDGEIHLPLIKQEHNDRYDADALDVFVRANHDRGALIFQGTFPDDGQEYTTHQTTLRAHEFIIPIPRRGLYYLEVTGSTDCAFGLALPPDKFVLESSARFYDKVSLRRCVDLYFQPVRGEFTLFLTAPHVAGFDCTVTNSDGQEVGRVQINSTAQSQSLKLCAEEHEVGSLWRLHLPVMDVHVSSNEIRYFSLSPSQYFQRDWKETGELFLRGSHTAYLQCGEEPLTVELAKYDLNLYDGADELDLVLSTLDGQRLDRAQALDFNDTHASRVRVNSYRQYDFDTSPGQVVRLEFAASSMDFNYDFRTNAACMVLQAGKLLLNERMASARLYFYAPHGSFPLDAVQVHDPPLDRHVMTLWDAQGRLVSEITISEGEREIEVPPEQDGKIWMLEIPSQGMELRTKRIEAFAVDPDALMPLSGNSSTVLAQLPTDTTPPDTFLLGPPELLDGKVTFRFGGTDLQTWARDLHYVCALNDERVRVNEAHISYEAVESGRYTFAVQAVDTSGNVDPSPATTAFDVPGFPSRSTWIALAAVICLGTVSLGYGLRRRRLSQKRVVRQEHAEPILLVSMFQLLRWVERTRAQLHRLRNQLPLIMDSDVLQAVLSGQNLKDILETRRRLMELRQELTIELAGYQDMRSLSSGAAKLVQTVEFMADAIETLEVSMQQLAETGQKDMPNAIRHIEAIRGCMDPVMTKNELRQSVLGKLSLGAWLREMVEGLPIQLILEETEDTLDSDSEALGHAVRSILRNAAEAGATHVKAKVLAEENGFHLRFHDDGKGIPDQLLRQLRSGVCLTTKRNGNGIGLQEVRNVMAYLGGSWQLESKGVGQGATVTLILHGSEAASPTQ